MLAEHSVAEPCVSRAQTLHPAVMRQKTYSLKLEGTKYPQILKKVANISDSPQAHRKIRHISSKAASILSTQQGSALHALIKKKAARLLSNQQGSAPHALIKKLSSNNPIHSARLGTARTHKKSRLTWRGSRFHARRLPERQGLSLETTALQTRRERRTAKCIQQG